MRIKIHQYSITMQNLVIFLLLSIFFIHSVKSLAEGVSAFSFVNLKNLIIAKLFLATFMFATILLVVQMRKFSRWPLLIFLLLVSWECFRYYLESEDKLILILSFLYLIFSIIFFLFWQHELANPIYNPGYSYRDVGRSRQHPIPVQLMDRKMAGGIVSGKLTNWGPESCFIALNGDVPYETLRKREMLVAFAGEVFTCRVELVTSYFRGVGLKILPDGEKNLSCHDWQEFYRILSDRGYYPLMQRNCH